MRSITTKRKSVKTLSKKKKKQTAVSAAKLKKGNSNSVKSIKIPNVTLADMKRATKLNGRFIPKSELVRIPSQKAREAIYSEAANAIANREIVALPTYGGRWWKCEVKIVERKNNPLPLFRWFRGTLELACLPHIFEKIQKELEVYSYADETALENRKASKISLSSIQSIPDIVRVWTSPNNNTFRTRKTVNAHSMELEKREQLINKVIYGYGRNKRELKPFKPTRAQSMDAGLHRFERDGLWVLGQEVSWQEERQQNYRQQIKKIRPLDYFISCNRERVKKEKILELQSRNETAEKIRYTLANAAKELRDQWKNMSDTEKKKWEDKIEKDMFGQNERFSDTEMTPSSECLNETSFVGKNRKNNVETTPIETGKLESAKLNIITPSPYKKSNNYQLTPDQVDLCYSTCISHYETIMNTVRARGLHHELADGGFDLLRERGRGRYDMTIPQFDDDSSFNFLISPNSFWMPIVRGILGEKVTLIHKGCFLSLPGAEIQVYHQDGLHLNKKVQKPCHAINVFIPLVDLSNKNGPTEFCLGTHMLGNENYNKDMCETPLMAAGVPVIFDYRLGHRGMGNTGNEPRPILYLTYSTENKCFVDSINFSKKRWRKIGDLVEMPLSREERSQKRRTQMEKISTNI